MEHLPWPETLSRDRPNTPYLCAGLEDNICHDIDEFLSWPETCGWTLDADLPILESARQCQSWLFFGAIRILMQESGRNFDIGDYIDSNCPNKVDTTSLQSLPFPTRYTLQVFSSTLSKYSSWFQQVVENLESESSSCNPWQQMIFNVFWSTVMLFELMVERHNEDYFERSFPSLYGNQSLAEALIMLGRCPNVLLRSHLSPLSAYRLLSIPLKTHTSHSECRLRRQCHNIDISEDTYDMQHAASCSGRADCHIMGIVRQNLAHLVETQRTPVVRSHLSRQGCLTINIVDGIDIDSVTAISHVWAGGLGNFKDNAHYHCQLLELHKDLEASTARRGRDSTVYYWLDTLCIPTNDSSLKSSAINAMAAVYAGCSSVLVIDPELIKIDRKKLDPRQIDVALFCSPWMARSWTLQEGALAVDLRLKFADSIYHYPSFDPSMPLSASTMIRSLWTRDVDRLAPPESFRIISGRPQGINFQRDELAIQRMKKDPQLRLVNVWNELCGRSSTKVDDIAAILAVFLNCSPGEVLDIQKDRRMLALLRTQTCLPISLLFARTHRKSSFWNPCFPTSSQSHNILTGAMGFMEFLPSGMLKLEDTRYIHFWKVLGEIPTSGVVNCQDPITKLCFKIRFLEDESKEKAIYHANVVFALSTLHADDLGQGTGKALSFVATKDDHEGLRIKFVAACVWQGKIDSSTVHTDVDADINSAGLATSTASASARAEYFTVTGPMDGSHFSNDFPLVLDMGMQVLHPDGT